MGTSSTANESISINNKKFKNILEDGSDSESSYESDLSESFSSASEISELSNPSRFLLSNNTKSVNIKIEPLLQCPQKVEDDNGSMLALYNKLFKKTVDIKLEQANSNQIKIKKEKKFSIECSVCCKSFCSHSVFKE